MKKTEILFSSILLPIDYLLLVLAGWSAYLVRFSKTYTENVREVVFALNQSTYMHWVYLIAFLWLVIFALAGLFSMRPSKKVFDLLNKIFLACSTGTLVVILIFFFSRELFTSRFIILAAWILSIIYISLAHLIVRGIQHLLYRKEIGVHRVILVGTDNTSEILAAEFYRNPGLGYKIIYRSKSTNGELAKKVDELASEEKVDEIIQADPNLSREEVIGLINLANKYHLDFKYAADLLGARRTNIDIKTINGIPLIEIKKTPLDGWGRVAKRIFDIIGAIFFLIIFSPLFLIITVLIKLDSLGPVFYKAERIGAKGKKFTLYKFRSMVVGADKMKEKLVTENERADGPLFKMKYDPRITRVGKFLRKTSLDELPNFWNVLTGKMSLVGPRPHEPNEVARYEEHHKKLLNIKPGITGMAQVSGRSTLDFETEVKLDTLYIETWSLKQDVIILFKTPIVVLRGKDAA
ncbi:sugar transferase [Candidatus Kuenenbacteria bacterium]|nr:sugar transferase [Candidatus Kuenenbacteria bacterium]